MSSSSAATVQVHISVGDPTEAGLCDHCLHARYSWPLAALFPGGVREVGTVEMCPECDRPQETVQRFLREWLSGMGGQS